jgi:hypothetical protein
MQAHLIRLHCAERLSPSCEMYWRRGWNKSRAWRRRESRGDHRSEHRVVAKGRSSRDSPARGWIAV